MQPSKLKQYLSGSGSIFENLVLQNSEQLFQPASNFKSQNLPATQPETFGKQKLNFSNNKREDIPYNKHKTDQSLVDHRNLNRSFFHNPIWWWSPPKDSLLAEFFEESTIHGLKFVAKRKSHLLERIFWIIAFLFGLTGSIVLIADVWTRYEKNPVIVTFQPNDLDIDRLPFPAVTFCNINKFSKSKVIELESIAHQEDGNNPAAVKAKQELGFVRNVCNAQQSFAQDFNYAAKRGTFSKEYNNNHIITEDEQDEMLDFLMKATIPCGDMIHLCIFGEHKIPCKDLFAPTITDYGKCCTFNILPYPLLMKDPRKNSSAATEVRKDGNDSNSWLPTQEELNYWMEWKYTEGMELGKQTSNTSRPFRQNRAGVPFGLSVLVDGNPEEYFCPASDSQGFRFAINSPLELPHVSEFSTVLELGKEVYVDITPQVVNADDEVRQFKREKRSCLFATEQTLTFFHPYTGTNCIDECTASIITERCNCSFFYLPRKDGVKMCNNAKNSEDSNCIESTKVSLLGTLKSNCSECDNLCEDITYSFETTTAELQDSSVLWEDPDVNADGGTTVPKWAKNKMSVVHIFYGADTTVPKLRKRLYGDVDLIASTGGLLGLCLGVSVLSIIEAIYYGTVRVCLKLYNKRQRKEDLVKTFISNIRRKQNQRKNGNNNVISLNRNDIPFRTAPNGYPNGIGIANDIGTRYPLRFPYHPHQH